MFVIKDGTLDIQTGMLHEFTIWAKFSSAVTPSLSLQDQ